MRLAWLALVPLAACGPDDTAGACKDTFVPGDLVFTEVFADYAAPDGGTGADDGKEWFEIYNNADRPVSLKGVTVVHAKIDGSDPKSHTIADITIAPGQYFTLGNATQDLLPPYVDYGYSADLGALSNTAGGSLTVKCGSQEIDNATYESVRSGRSRQLTSQSPPDYTLNDDPANWCEANATEFETNNFGTPGSENDCAAIIAGACSDGGVMRDAVPPNVGDLIITELMPRPTDVSATVGQWVEIKALSAVDLNGVGLDRANDNAGPAVISSPSCVHLAAGDYALMARSSDMTLNGGLPTVGSFGFSINPSTNPDLQIVFNGTVIDAITWTSSTSARSKSLDPDFQTATGNDDEASFCDGQAIYGTADRGTPGADNEQCPLVAPPGMCADSGGNFRPIRKPAAGMLVITEFLADALDTTGDPTQEWFEIKNIGTADFDLNELRMKGNAVTTYPIQAATCINIAGGQYGLFAHDKVNNGGLVGVDATFTFPLANSNGSITILDGTTVLDAVTWTSVMAGKSRQLQPNLTTTTDNDLTANFCHAHASQTYGTAGNLGTPKADNVCM